MPKGHIYRQKNCSVLFLKKYATLIFKIYKTFISYLGP